MEGRTSAWKTQTTGIRQGCTLSPYLFIILMTVIFHDVHDDPVFQKEIEQDRPINNDIDEVLYADDTILCSTTESSAQKLLHRVEEISALFGLNLNKDKCDAISTNPNSGGIRFINGEKVKRKNETKYLGCKLNYKSDLNVELGKRISETTYTWKNLNHFGNTVTAARPQKSTSTTLSSKANCCTALTQPT